MTIESANEARVSLACDGVTKIFPINAQAYLDTDFEVILTAPASSGGAQTTLVLNSDYSMATSGTDNPPKWTLTTLAVLPYASGYTLQAIVAPVTDQQTQYVQGQQFPSAAVQENLDRLTQMVQRLADQISRAPHAPDGDLSPAMVLPNSIQRASMVQGFDPYGNVIVYDPAALAGVAIAGSAHADVFTCTAGQTAFTLTANPGTLENLVVVLDGATLVPGDDYTWGAGGFVLTAPTLLGQRLSVHYTGSIALSSVPTSSVGDAQLIAGSNVYNAAKGGAAEVTVASAATVDLGAQASASVLITGVTTITSFGSSPPVSGLYYQVRFSGALLLTYNASTLILPGAQSITTAAGDSLTAKYEGAGVWRVTGYRRASDIPTLSNGDTLKRGVAICKQKPALTARASTTTMANDPDLSYAIPAAGTYAIEVLVPLSGGAGGVAFNLNFSGSITNSISVIELIANSTPVADKSLAIAATVATVQQNAAAVTALDAIRIKALLVAGGPGTLAVSWAQNSSNVTATNFGQGAYMNTTLLS